MEGVHRGEDQEDMSKPRIGDKRQKKLNLGRGSEIQSQARTKLHTGQGKSRTTIGASGSGKKWHQTEMEKPDLHHREKEDLQRWVASPGVYYSDLATAGSQKKQMASGSAGRRRHLGQKTSGPKIRGKNKQKNS